MVFIGLKFRFTLFFKKIGHSVHSFSDVPALGRLFIWWLIATTQHLKLLREYSAPERLP